MFPDVQFSVSSTTRQPRPGEVSGKDYIFISREDFRERIERGEFVEWVENYGELYGTSKKTLDAFLEKGYDLIMDIEPRGAKAIRQHYPGAVLVFILPPSLPALLSRLASRGENAETVERRLRRAQDEIREALCYDYIILNEKISEAVDQFRAIYIDRVPIANHLAEVNTSGAGQGHKAHHCRPGLRYYGHRARLPGEAMGKG